MARESCSRAGERCKFFQSLIESLLAFARAELELSEIQGDGQSARTHLESVWRQTRVMPEGLNTPQCPIEVAYLWAWFIGLSQKRTSNGFGPNPISDAEIIAWSSLRRITLTPFDIDAINALDDVFMTYQAKQQKKAAK